MVRAVRVEGLGVVRQCEVCSLGYADREDAELCEAHCKTHDSCDLEIGRRAVYKPS